MKLTNKEFLLLEATSYARKQVSAMTPKQKAILLKKARKKMNNT